MSPRARALPHVLALAVIVWLLGATLWELRQQLSPYDASSPNRFHDLGTWRWRLRSQPARDLRAFLASLEDQMHDGATARFSSFDSRRDRDLYRYMWAAYALPRQNLLRSTASGRVDYWITYRTRLDSPRFELVWESAEGALYRSREG